MKKIVPFFILLVLVACSKEKGGTTVTEPKILAIKGADLSFLPEVRAAGIVTKNEAGLAEDMLQTLKNNGVNCIRLRLWKDPVTSTSSFNTVKALSQEIKSKGMQVWLSVHYSDTWADPGNQAKPAAWNSTSFTQLEDSVFEYTKKIATEIHPDYIQVGNEINNGFLYPEGSRSNQAQMKALISSATRAIRSFSPASRILLHYAGTDGAGQFFNEMDGTDYDLIGISYYPVWHGKDLTALSNSLQQLSDNKNKSIVIAETAYPFTFDFNDFTHNIIGDNSQVLPAYPASKDGQLNFLKKIRSVISNVPKGIGFCYWGAEWISMYGPASTNGSPWENQALWGFDNVALPAVKAFQ